MSRKPERSFTVTTPPPRAVTEAATPPSEKAEGHAAPAKPAGVMVKNVTSTWFRQPATGTKIDAGQEALLKDDGWLAAQIEAKFLQKV